MKWKLINKTPQTYAVVLNEGEEVMESLHAFAAKEGLTGGRFSGIGAFSEVMLGHFKPEKRGYKRIPIPEQVEVLSLTGDVTLENGAPQLHAQVVVGKSDGTAHGGHLISARARPVLEVVLVESASHLRRVHDERSGLALLSFDGTLDIT
jgi:hypothetical protein